MIEWTERHETVWQAYLDEIGFGYDQQRVENHNRGGLHRLVHLVPDAAPDQVTLARTLAEVVLHHLWPRMADPTHALVGSIIGEAHSLENDGNDGYRRLVELAESPMEGHEKWKPRIAWAACQELTKPELRVGVEHDGEERRKIIKPIPDPIQNLMERYFRREVDMPKRPRGRHDPAERPYFDGGIVLMIHAASESALNPTRNETTNTQCAIDVVTEVLHAHDVDSRTAETIKDVWERRSREFGKSWNLIPG